MEKCHEKAFWAIFNGKVFGQGIAVREVAVGFRRLGIDLETCRLPCQDKRLQELMNNPEIGGPLKVMCKYGLVDYRWYRKICQSIIASEYGVWKANLIKFIDVVFFGKEVWVVEIKPKLNYEAVGQAIVYSDLFEEDHPELGTPKVAIVVCDYGDPLIENTLRKLGIKVVVL